MKLRKNLTAIGGVAAFVALSLGQSAIGAGIIYSDAADGMLEARGSTPTDLPPSSPWPQVHPSTNGNFETTVGEWFGSGPDGPGAYGLTTIVLPFQLPDFGAVSNPFLTADLGVMSNANTFDNNSTDIDLYGLSRVDSDPSIQTTDWYSGASFDPSATLIQESFLTPTSPRGFDGAPNNFTDATGDANLVAFLNAQYAGGANAGEFVFLRLSYGSDTFATGRDNYNIHMQEADATGFGAPDEFTEDPRITFTAVPEPTSVALIGLGLVAVVGRRRA